MHGINQDTLERNAAILDEVSIERIRQDNKWGVQDHPLLKPHTFGGNAMPMSPRRSYELLAESQKLLNGKLAAAGQLSWHDILLEEFYEAFAEDDPVRAREEFIQVAAVAASIVEWMDRTGYCKEKGDERAQA